MAIHAQYPSNYLLFNNDRNEEETKDHMEYSRQQLPPPLLFYNTGVNINGDRQRKRGREIASFQMVPTPPHANLFSPPPTIQSPPSIDLTQLPVSTGLRLSPFDDQEEDLSSLVCQQKLEIEQYLLAQGEQLRRTLAERQGAAYRALLVAAEETAAQKLKEEEVELNRAAKKTGELEAQIARLRAEALRWQAKSMSDQSVAESLHARIRQASMRAETGSVAAVQDSESVYVDPNRLGEWGRTCRACGASGVSVVVLPCRHLCLCMSCDAADNGVICCPVCHVVKAGSVQVRLS